MRRLLALASWKICILQGLSGAPVGPAHAAQDVELRVLSSRPDAVSGGDVLVELTSRQQSEWTAMLNGTDVSRSFQPSVSPGVWLSLLKGLDPGSNRLEVALRGRVILNLEMLNHAISGPVFSGPQQVPFFCQTEENGLGLATDDRCQAQRVVQYYYKPKEPVGSYTSDSAKDPSDRVARGLLPGFKFYDPSHPPSDVARTVTSGGRKVDYIVRRERGTINRGVYEIQFLHQPGEPLPTPWVGEAHGWNKRLVYKFGHGCGAGYRQGVLSPPAALDELLLSAGYALATSTLNTFENNCNDRIAAETLSMVKEYFVEKYGEPEHTIGIGASGGALQQQLIAQNYPGLLDGIILSSSFPDAVTYAQSWTDCRLLGRAFQGTTQAWTEEQKSAVSGFATWRTCVPAVLSSGRPWIHPWSCPAVIPHDRVYDPVARPNGIRCDIYSNEVNFFGRDPRTGKARRPLDNVGVQYGLNAFNNGTISAEQFIELNERVGGYDDDGNFQTMRTEADAESVRLAYERGLILTGGGGLSQIPIIDWRLYADDLADNHDRFRSLVTRERMIKANGSAENHVILVYPRPEFPSLLAARSRESLALGRDYQVRSAERTYDLIQKMGQWLSNIANDDGAGTAAQKVGRNRPTELADGCWTTDGQVIVEPATYGTGGKCNEKYPLHADPRLAAGAPLTDDVLKCSLKPLSSSDYSHELSGAQWTRLKAVFPSGVCDYSRPGVGQHVTRATWQRYVEER